MLLRLLILSLISAAVSGCFAEREKKALSFEDEMRRATLRASARSDPSKVALERAREHFRNEDYGLAETYFRKAVELNPNSGDAWLGLAASYDRIRRFDLAERAYEIVVRKVGYTTTVHNNLGYHHYLRGNREKARHHFNAALQMDPDNTQVRNNLKLLDTS